jgi:hypothetical protein
MTYGAQAAWIEERPGQEIDVNADVPQVRAAKGRNWLAEAWVDCQVVALFDADESQVCPLLRRSNGLHMSGHDCGGQTLCRHALIWPTAHAQMGECWQARMVIRKASSWL